MLSHSVNHMHTHHLKQYYYSIIDIKEKCQLVSEVLLLILMNEPGKYIGYCICFLILSHMTSNPIQTCYSEICMTSQQTEMLQCWSQSTPR